MTWAFAFFATFGLLFVLTFAFFIFIYVKEYDREERIVAEVTKAKAEILKYQIVPTYAISTTPKKEKVVIEDTINNGKKKNLN